jgi:hypothetical protein
MPTICWTSGAGVAAALVLAAPLAAQEPLALKVENRRGAAAAVLPLEAGAVARIPLTIDPRARPASVEKAALVARAGERLLVVTDTHASRVQGLGRCRAGQEVFVRIIESGPPTREVQRLKLASCLDGIVPAEPPVIWTGATGTLEVRWLAGPGGMASATFRLVSGG